MAIKASKRYRAYIAYFCLCLLLLAGFTGWGLYAGWFLTIDWDNPEPFYLQESTIHQVNGALVLDYNRHNIDYIPLKESPDDLVNAFIAVEDSRFYQHSGVDIIGIFRALAANIVSGQVVQGGSTITQQLARNLFLGHERTLERKLAEISIAFQLEHKYEKDEIMEMYLNQIYFGDGNWGVSQAARTYFDKDVANLTLAESSLLAGLVQSPSTYAPTRGWTLAVARQKVVLNRMVELNYITQQKAEEAKMDEPAPLGN